MAGTECRVVVTCEHGGNRVPPAYRACFAGADDVLAGHRGHDPGALVLARQFARTLHAPLVSSTVTRLLVELNRSPHHPSLFSRYTSGLDAATREEILRRHYRPYRERVEKLVAEAVAAGASVCHLSVHSFTPVLHDEVRRADVGLLYDPSRPGERDRCDRWLESLARRRPDLRLRRNYPYRGTADGFTTHLRRRFGADDYAGIELEVNQKWPLAGGADWRRLRADLVATFVG